MSRKQDKYAFVERMFQATRQVAAWLGPLWPSELPYGSEAYDSCTLPAMSKVYTASRLAIQKKQKGYLPVSPDTIYRVEFSKTPLADSKEEILAAIQRNDFQYFIQLARVLKDNPGRLPVPELFPDIHNYPSLIEALWVDGLLWLMTGKAVVQFFELVVGVTITEENYKVVKKRRNLFKHPDAPICGVRQCAGQTSIQCSPEEVAEGVVLAPEPRRACELVFREGWKLTRKGLFGPSR